jgi:hypothetical protein
MTESVLDIIGDLLDSTKKPKKSKSTEQSKQEVPLKENTFYSSLEYISEEKWIELGKPPWGFTTARIKQYSKDSLAYKEIYIEYLRNAILFLKLTNTIGWWSEVDEDNLNRCRKEIAKFKLVNGLSKGDMAEINDLIYHSDYSRKTLVKQLIKESKEILEIKQELEKDKEKRKLLTLDNIAKIPSNIAPKLEFVVLPESLVVEQEITTASISPFSCDKHPLYSGMRKPRSGCLSCIRYYNENMKSGKKEKRVRKDDKNN